MIDANDINMLSDSKNTGENAFFLTSGF